MTGISPGFRIVIMGFFNNIQNTPLNGVYTAIVRESIGRCPVGQWMDNVAVPIR